MNHRTPHRVVRQGTVLVLALFGLVGCEEAPPDPAALAAMSVIGPAGEGGDPGAGAVWQEAFESWPKEGNLSVLFGDPEVQGQMDLWMMGQMPPSAVPEIGLPVMVKVRAFNDRLIALDGGWGSLPAPDAVRAMAVRGIRKTLWADARAAVAEGNVDRLVDVLVVMATLPRVAHTYDATSAGVLATVGLADGFTWAMGDATTEGFGIKLDPSQCARLRKAASWLESPDAFGVPQPGDEQRASVLKQYEERTRTRARQLLTQLCG